ncbi:acyltransferase [Pelagicoccus sp. SDUM812002]|uniref:acyltransferase n=1 Tax=Pelagicoccus sp. SDUM812002 TaxID=3041266 RepID=UPI00280DBA7F|nr:acyltransferase [Pelagicoccus sp. SDUM812002]MDQ8188163.1 acyltransferase [Pelagicoccus sp. SDUM812002]
MSTNGVLLGDRVTLGDFCWIQGTSYLSDPGDSLVIHSNVYIGPYAVIGFHGRVEIGSNTAIGANLQLSAQSHDIDAVEDIAQKTVPSRGIVIGSECWIGNGVKILDGVEVGDNVVIGAGAVVNKSIPCGAIAVGIPARVVKRRNLV